MGRWESLVDQKIREAMEQGEFDNLAGKGEPIDLSENPFEDPDWRTAHRMLRNAGFAPAWIDSKGFYSLATSMDFCRLVAVESAVVTGRNISSNAS